MKTEKKKLMLDDLKVQSFVTSLDSEDAVLLKGGTGLAIEAEIDIAVDVNATPIVRKTFRQGDYNVCTLA